MSFCNLFPQAKIVQHADHHRTDPVATDLVAGEGTAVQQADMVALLRQQNGGCRAGRTGTGNQNVGMKGVVTHYCLMFSVSSSLFTAWLHGGKEKGIRKQEKGKTEESKNKEVIGYKE